MGRKYNASGDKDLLDLIEFEDISIMKSSDFLAVFE